MLKPFEHCYWVVKNKLLAGEYPRTKELVASQEKIDALVRAGVTLFVDLTEENEGLLPYAGLVEHKGISHRRFPIRDVSIPHSKELTTAVLDAMDAEIEKGGIVYVHCWGGVGRTGLIVGCWLARPPISSAVGVLLIREISSGTPAWDMRTCRHPIAGASRTLRATRLPCRHMGRCEPTMATC